jgi:hypothetical protein
MSEVVRKGAVDLLESQDVKRLSDGLGRLPAEEPVHDRHAGQAPHSSFLASTCR